MGDWPAAMVESGALACDLSRFCRALETHELWGNGAARLDRDDLRFGCAWAGAARKELFYGSCPVDGSAALIVPALPDIPNHMDEQSYELIGAARAPSWIVLCDHASNHVPAEIGGGDLGLPPEDMARHIAYDVGARGTALALAEALGCPMIASRFSRLVIDPNRGEDDPTLLMKLYDGSVIPGNRQADAAEKERRLAAYHRPYHDAITALIDDAVAGGISPRLVSIHSFTPQLRGRPKRPWHVGLLWDRDDRLFRPLYERLLAEKHLTVGDNEPYAGQLAGDCMWRHGTQRGLEHVLIEVRNDLIETDIEQARWGRDIARWLAEACSGVDSGSPAP